MSKKNFWRLCLVLIAQSAYSQSAIAQTDTASPEHRNPRTFAVSAEIGLNSLGSLAGPVVSYYPNPRIAVEAGAGIFTVGGLRPGIRARYLFTPLDRVSFSCGLGYKYGLGSGDAEVEVKDPDTQADLKIVIDPSSFIDGMLGFEFLANNGFLVIANVGYSQLLGGKYYKVTSGTLSEKGGKAFDFVFDSGILLSVSLGKAF